MRTTEHEWCDLKQYSHYGKTVQWFIKNWNIEWPAVSYLGIYPEKLKAGTQRDTWTCVLTAPYPHSQKVETTQMPINRWMDTQMWYMYTVKYYSALKGKEIDTCYNRDEPWRLNAKWNKPVTKGWIPYDYIYMRYIE